MKKSLFYFTLIIAFLSCKTSQNGKDNEEQETKPITIETYFSSLKSFICDNVIVVAEKEVHSDISYSKISELLLIECKEDEVRMNFKLEDEGRMAIAISLFQGELLLKHDVRDKNLAPAEITMFGGFSSELTEDYFVSFDSHKFGTQSMWPGYEDTSWEILLNKDEGYFAYKQKKNNDAVVEILFTVIK